METAILEKPEITKPETTESGAAVEAAPEIPQTQEFETPKISDKHALKLFFQPEGTLRLTVANVGNDGAWSDYSYPSVKLYQASPLSAPGRYIVLHDGKGEEITMADTMADFAPESRTVAEDEIRRRYLTARVKAVTSIKIEFGITYWNVETDKGSRDFVVQSLSESCIWLSDRHILLIDVDGNRFEVLDRFAMDENSLKNLALVL